MKRGCSLLVISFLFSICAINGELYLFYSGTGELNDRCETTRDCRYFGYICTGRKCVCEEGYVPDKRTKHCVGAVNQKCVYDEHCIPGAFCMNQSICKCKENNPVVGENGFECSGTSCTYRRTRTTKQCMMFATFIFMILLII